MKMKALSIAVLALGLTAGGAFANRQLSPAPRVARFLEQLSADRSVPPWVAWLAPSSARLSTRHLRRSSPMCASSPFQTKELSSKNGSSSASHCPIR